MKWTWTVSAAALVDAPRADVLLMNALNAGEGEGTIPGAISRNQLHRLMEDGAVLTDGHPVKKTSRLATGAIITIEFPEPRPMELIPEDRPLEILFQDEHLLVLNKPPGISVHPSTTESEGTLVHALLHHVRDLSGIGGVLRPGIVHRLDKDTSGALVISKSDVAHQKLVEIFAKHDIERVYHAFCYGAPSAQNGKIETLIGRNPRDRKKMSAEVKTGRRAVTHYRVLERFSVSGTKAPFASLIELRLETGRTHQIRVHLTALGHSLLGDPVYGTPTEKQAKWLALPQNVRDAIARLPGQALHASVLGFKHPVTEAPLRFEAEEPAEFAALRTVLKNYVNRPMEHV